MDPQSDIASRLAEPFEPSEVKFKPAVVSGNRALALCYVDARVIQDRLDEVMGVTGWQDDYECLADGSVVCRLRLKIDGEWLVKVDVGSPSEQPDGGDRLKAAFSDALKRAAVKFGIGRYLYRMPSQWVDYDPQKRAFVRQPVLPASGQPKPTAVAKQAPKHKTSKEELLTQGITRMAGVRTLEQLCASSEWAQKQGFDQAQLTRFNDVWEKVNAELRKAAPT